MPHPLSLRFFPLAFGVLFLVCVASPALAQQGQINGVVSDTTGGVLPGVTVRAVETGTGFSRETVTGIDGSYSFTSLRPTTYDLSAELAGFRSFQRQGIQLQANQNVTINMKLEVGSLAESVTVVGATPAVDVTSATLSEVVDQKRIVELPLNGRDAAQLTTLVTGMVLTSVSAESSKTIPGAVRLSTNGGEAKQTSFRLDGMNNTDPYFEENQPFPFPDALQEFSIQTSNYSVSQGNRAGAVVNAVTKSGTNQLHGGAFGYVRNRVFNEKNYFAKEKDWLAREQFGGLLGGPIKQSKTFYFGAYQATLLKNKGGDVSAFGPTQEMLNGDFSQCGTACNKAITDPLTKQPFPGNQIPVSRFDPSSLAVMKYMPKLTDTGQVLIVRNMKQTNQQFVNRIDHKISGRDEISSRYMVTWFHNDPIYEPGNLLTFRTGSLKSDVNSHNVVGGWNHTFSSTKLNEFHVGYNRLSATRIPPTGMPGMTTDLGVKLPLDADPKSVQGINVTGFWNTGDMLKGWFGRDGWEVNDRVTWVAGRHNIEFGGELQVNTVHIQNQYYRTGTYDFNGNATGNAQADFFLGIMSSFTHGTGEYKDSVMPYPSFYFADDFRVTPHITVSYGARYEPTFPWHEKNGRAAQWFQADYDNNVHSTAFPLAPRGEVFPGDSTFIGKDGAEYQWANISPRVGFAWDITGDGRTSLRGGGGRFYDQHRDGEYENQIVDNQPWESRITIANPQGPFSDPYRGRSAEAGLVSLDNIPLRSDTPWATPVNVTTHGPTYRTPLTYNYNIMLERELGHGYVVRAAYVGSRNMYQRQSIQLNPLNPALYTPGVQLASFSDSRRLYASEGIGSISQEIQNRSSVYNSLQTSASRRFSGGFQVNANYTLSKVNGNVRGDLSPYYVGNDLNGPMMWGPLSQDRRHRATVSWVWNLPGAKMGGATGTILGDWQWSGIMQYESGSPLTITSGTDRSRTGINADRAKTTGVSTAPPSGSANTLWFNPAAFTVADWGTVGNVVPGMLYGPGQQIFDMGLFRTFRLGGDESVQFRAEFFNIFNKVNFNDPGTNASSSSLGVISTARDPRILQFGLKFGF